VERLPIALKVSSRNGVRTAASLGVSHATRRMQFPAAPDWTPVRIADDPPKASDSASRSLYSYPIANRKRLSRESDARPWLLLARLIAEIR
jgi:hypothetical protein